MYESLSVRSNKHPVDVTVCAFCKIFPVQSHGIADITTSAIVRDSLLRVFTERITYQCYALLDVLTMPPTGGGSETRRFEVGPWRSYVGKFFVLLDSIVICPLYKLTLRSAPSHSRTDGQSLLFTVKILSRSTPTCGGRCKVFVFDVSRTHSRRSAFSK